MLPPGRRRVSPFQACALLCLFASTASAAILGIDLGTEYIKAALVKPGIPLEIVLTKDSRRKEAATVAFKPAAKSDAFPERLYGSDAVALAARFPDNVYPNLKPLLGVEGDAAIQEYKSRRPMLEVGLDPTRKTATFTSELFEKSETFLVEELLAMELQNIRANAEAMAGKGSSVRDVVITVPPFYTRDEKLAVELAAELAGLKVIALLSDGLAVGINYATSRTFPSISEGGKAEHHLVFDMGAGSTTATIVRFQGRTIKDVGRLNKTIQEVAVLGTAWDRKLGGDTLNALIADDIVKELAASPQAEKVSIATQPIKAHARASARILKEAERVRQVLSANSGTSAGFEGIYEGVDFKYKISRERYEQMAASHAGRIDSLVEEALATANLTMADLDSVILHGGVIRTPFVQRQLEKVVGDKEKLRSNVNSDEAAVFGAAFKGASMSASFRVKDIRTSDCAGYAVGARWRMDGKERVQKLFLHTSQTGVEKQVTFKDQQDFAFDFFQLLPDHDGALGVRPSTIATIATKNLTASVAQLMDKHGCTAKEIDTKFAIRLHPDHGAPEVVSGTVSCEVEETDKKAGVVDGVKNLFGLGSKKSDQEALKGGDQASSSSSTSKSSSSSTVSSSTKKASKSKSVAAAKKSAEPEGPTKKLVTIPLAIESTAAGIPAVSAAEMKRMKTRLSEFDASDKSRRLREEAVNTLEAFTYRGRDLLENEMFKIASTETERVQIDGKLHDASEWLYGDGAGAKREVLRARLKELKSLVDPIESRVEESAKRPAEVKLLQEALASTKKIIGVIQESVDEAARASRSSSSATATATAPATTETPNPSTSVVDDFADLEEDDATSSTTSTTSAKKATPTPEKPIYTPEDVTTMTDAYVTVDEWLTTKLAQQAELSPQQDPVLLVRDLAAKNEELNRIASTMLRKKTAQIPPKPKYTSSKTKTKAKKTKSGKSNVSSKTVTMPAAGQATGIMLEDEMPDIQFADGQSPPSSEEMNAIIEQAKKKVAADQKAAKEKTRRGKKEAEEVSHDPNEL